MNFNQIGGPRARRALACALLAATALAAAPAAAEQVTDPTGDFIPSFTGPHNGDLDVTSANATFDGATFKLEADVAAPIGTTGTSLYVWGINRGQGKAGFAQIGATGVLFDAVVIIDPNNQTIRVVNTATGQAQTLPASAISVSGNHISVNIPSAALTPNGLESAKFLFNLWPRSMAGGDETIPDFAPDNSDFQLTLAFPTPEEASVQTEAVFDDATDRFQRIQRRLDAQRAAGADAPRLGGFFDVGARFGTRGTGDSLARDPVNRILAGGLDYALSANAVLGIGFAADRTHTGLASGGTLSADIYSPEFYVGVRRGLLHFDGYAAYSAVDYHSRRLLPIGDELLEATASPGGHAYSFGGTLGYDLGKHGLVVTPLVDLIYTRAHVDAYSEANAQDFGAALAARDRTSARLGLGAQLGYSAPKSWGAVAVHAKGRYVTELGDRQDRIDFAYTAQPDTLLTVFGPRTGVDYGAFDLGLDIRGHAGVQAGIDYETRVDNHGFIDHAATLSAGIAF